MGELGAARRGGGALAMEDAELGRGPRTARWSAGVDPERRGLGARLRCRGSSHAPPPLEGHLAREVGGLSGTGAGAAPTTAVFSTSDDAAAARAQGRGVRARAWGWRAATAAGEERKDEEDADMWGP